MAWFTRATQQVDLVAADLEPEPPVHLLTRAKSSVSKMLDRFRGDALGFETGIAEMTERLRQTRIAIAAFETAERMIAEGEKPKVAASAVPEDSKIGRLVPRSVKAGRS